MTGQISRCFQIPTVPAGGADYTLGIHYKTSGTGDGGCYGNFNQDSNCAQGVGVSYLNLLATQSSSWTTSSSTVTAYEGTSSINVTCYNNTTSVTFDQFFLRLTDGTGLGF